MVSSVCTGPLASPEESSRRKENLESLKKDALQTLTKIMKFQSPVNLTWKSTDLSALGEISRS